MHDERRHSDQASLRARVGDRKTWMSAAQTVMMKLVDEDILVEKELQAERDAIEECRLATEWHNRHACDDRKYNISEDEDDAIIAARVEREEREQEERDRERTEEEKEAARACQPAHRHRPRRGFENAQCAERRGRARRLGAGVAPESCFPEAAFLFTPGENTSTQRFVIVFADGLLQCFLFCAELCKRRSLCCDGRWKSRTRSPHVCYICVLR